MSARLWTFGDDVNTDVIMPGKYLKGDIAEIAEHVMAGIDEDFAHRVRPGDVLLAGRNFGSGSSREMAPAALRECGLAAVVAQSFGGIFFRNCINLGLPALRYTDRPPLTDGNEVDLDLAAGTLGSGGKTHPLVPLRPAIRQILDRGGLRPFIREQLASAT